MIKTDNLSSTDVIIVSIDNKRRNIQQDINELKELCKTIGYNIKEVFIQNRKDPDAKFYVGKGKLLELKDFVEKEKIKIVVFEASLSNIQRKNINKLLKIKIFDRNEIILEIFKLHAQTLQAKLQVELAKLSYELPRLIGKGKELSRLGGGIGTLGPGETELEFNRRTIRKRISFLKKKLKKISNSQALSLKRNSNHNFLRISIVGYTSAGKSTLLKTLSSDENIIVSKDLFSTLSTVSRKIHLPSGFNAVFSDTVGFINNIPVDLIESFKSTLSHINYSDMILMLVDLSDENYKNKMNSVNLTLSSILNKDIPILLVFNKIDKVATSKLNLIKKEHPQAYLISATSKDNANNLLKFVEKYLLDKGILQKMNISNTMENRIIVNKFRGSIGIIQDLKTIQIVSTTGIIQKISKQLYS